MVSASAAVLLASLALPSALAVSLADFAPRASNLPSGCQTLYTADITGCSPSDFENQSCSSGCISALNSLVSPVTRACIGVSGGNIIAAVIAGKATGLLCPNAGSYGGSSGTTTDSSPTTTAAAATTTTSSAAPQSTTQATVKSSAQASSTSSNTGATSSATKSSTQSTTLVFSTNTVIPQPSTDIGSSIVWDTSTPSGLATSTQSNAKASQSAIDQGGSPFSAQAGMSGADSMLKVSPMLLAMAAGGAALLLLAGAS